MRPRTTMRRAFRYALLAFAIAATSASCHESDSPSGQLICSGSVTSLSQVGSTLVANGGFAKGQPILTLTSGASHQTIIANDYNGATATFSIVGIPKGTYTISFQLSCDKGGIINIDSLQTSITIT